MQFYLAFRTILTHTGPFTLTTPTESTFTLTGVTLHFSTVVLNSGTTTLASVGISDALADAGSVSCPTTVSHV